MTSPTVGFASMLLHRDGAELKHTQRVKGKITSICFSSAGSLLATGGDDGVVRLWDTDECNIQHTCRQHTAAVWSICFSPGGSQLASGAWDNSICIWDPWTGTLIRQLCGHKGPVWSVAFSATGSLLISGSEDQRVIVWDPSTGSELASLKYGRVHAVYCVAVNPQETLVAEGSFDHTIRLWGIGPDTQVQRQLSKIREQARKNAHRTFRARKSQEALRQAKERVRQQKFDFFGAQMTDADSESDSSQDSSTVNPERPMVILKAHQGPVVSLAFSLDGRMLASGSHDATVVLWDPDTGNILQRIQSAARSPVWCCVFSRDSTLLTLGTGTGEIEFWDPRQRNTLLLRFQAHKKYIGTCAFSSDGLLLGTGADDETFRLWSLLSPPELLALCHTRLRQSQREKELEAARQRERAALERQRLQQLQLRNQTEAHAEQLYRQSLQTSRQPRRAPSIGSSPRTGPVNYDKQESNQYLGSDDIRADDMVDLDELNQARLAAMQELARIKRQALDREHASVVATNQAITEKQAELARRTRLGTQALAFRKDLESSSRVGGVIGQPPSRNMEYVDAIHRRLQELYTRVGRQPRGSTLTELSLEELAPNDLERQASFQDVLLRTLDYQVFKPHVLGSLAGRLPSNS
eukprot:m.136627 g.136627  ORF g.136627 m.136627 type:complete len:638 (-) comp15873_c0_seq40:212-2125(-)